MDICYYASTWIIFVTLWGMLIYVIALKLYTTPEIELNETLQIMNKIPWKIHNSRKKNTLKYNLIENYIDNLCKNHVNTSQQFIKKFKYQLEQFGNLIYANDGLYQNNLLNSQVELASDCVHRRQVQRKTTNMWKYFNSEMKKLKNSRYINKKSKQLKNDMELGVEYKRSIISNIDQMRSVDGYELYRHNELEDLSNLVQKRLTYLQNPVDCEKAKKLLCNLDHACGFGCQLHHIAVCLIVAYATERTLILKSTGWNYNPTVWEEIFQPISKTCIAYDIDEIKKWPGSENDQLILLPFINYHIWLRIPSYVFAVPDDLASNLIKLHGEPIAWWTGQIYKYLLKPNYVTQKMIENDMKKIGWRKPIVGIHIRRTDKIGIESVMFSVEEYMTYVEDYYLTLEMNSTKIERRVFLASDDVHVYTEIRKKYPQYTIIGRTDIAATANIKTRYTYSSLNAIILDIHILSLSDYLVCAMNSNVCRLAYELMQNYYADASDRFVSLYDYYYFPIRDGLFEAILSHTPRNKYEIHVKHDDSIRDGIGYLNGFAKGINTRTKLQGLYPLFKVLNIITTAKFPDYPKVKYLHDLIKN